MIDEIDERIIDFLIDNEELDEVDIELLTKIIRFYSILAGKIPSSELISLLTNLDMDE